MESRGIARRHVLAGGIVLAGGLTVAAGGPRASPTVTYLSTEDGRDVRISIWPAIGQARGTILFSHGALSAPEKYLRLLVPWSEAGFEILAPLHVDSTNHPDHAKFGMVESWRARLLDMRALSAFVDQPAYIAAGHSYGGLVALTLAGASADIPPGVKPPLRDPHARSALALSPPGITPGLIAEGGYGTIAVPALIQTGDRDVPYGSKDGRWQVHLAAYEAAPKGDKYGLVLPGVDHYFGGLICEPSKPGPPQEAQLQDVVALSTLFIEAYGTDDATARRKLEAALAETGHWQLTRK